MIIKKGTHIFLIYFLLTFILRFWGIFPSVIDHDESTYMVIANEMVNGKMLYADVIDIKPAGIFLIFGFIIKIFGNSIAAVRIFTILIISLTALFIYKAKERIFPEYRSSFASGIIYIIFISLWSFYGGSVNTEIFFNMFTVIALIFLLKNKHSINFFLFGIFTGIGFIIKYVVIFDLAAFLLFFLIINVFRHKEISLMKYIKQVFIVAVSFSIPFFLLNLFYYITGYYEEFLFITFIAPGRYVTDWELIRIGKFIGDFILRFSPILFLLVYVLTYKKTINESLKEIKILVLLWIFFDLIAILLPGNDFAHYFIQLMLPVSFLSGIFFMKDFKVPLFLKKIFRRPFSYIIFAVFIIIVNISQKKDYYDKVDFPREVSDYLQKNMEDNETLYTSNYQHILYFLLDKEPPIKYVHRSLMTNPRHIKALRIDTEFEINKIIEKAPKYIVAEDSTIFPALNKLLAAEYKQTKSFNKNIHVYVHKGKL